MFELLVIVVFCWLLFKVIKLTFHITWGMAKVIALLLCIFACPLLVFGILFAGGLVLIVPVLIVVGAYTLVKALVE